MKTTKRELPHDVGAERALIASLILNQNVFDKITDLKITEEDFYDKRLGAIYRSIYEIILHNRPVDYITVSSMLSDLNKLEFIGGNNFLTEIVDDHVTDANIYGYAINVKEKSTLRNIIETSLQIASDGYEFEGHMKEYISNVETKFFRLTNQSKVNKSKSLHELVRSNLKTLEDTSRKLGEVEGLSTGYGALDKYLLGLRSGQLIIIGARPGMGKSALALNLAVNNVQQSNLPALIFTLEMQCEELSMRILSSMAKVDGKKIRTKNFGPNDLSHISKAASTMSKMPIYIDDTSAITLMEIMSICRKKKAEEGLSLVVIDYLQLMGVNKSVPREQQISEISRGLKGMAKDLGIPVIALSQLNRVSETNTSSKSYEKGVSSGGGKNYNRPTSSNLRESGAIEQDADAILLIYRDDYYNKENSPEPGVAEIIITKNRGGETGTVKLGWVGAITSFENLLWEPKKA